MCATAPRADDGLLEVVNESYIVKTRKLRPGVDMVFSRPHEAGARSLPFLRDEKTRRD